MAKKVIKEIIIMLLLCLAIILILGVLLYEYVPSNKIIPEEVSYTTPEEVKEELSKGEMIHLQQVERKIIQMEAHLVAIVTQIQIVQAVQIIQEAQAVQQMIQTQDIFLTKEPNKI